jgi:hypothetical protein
MCRIAIASSVLLFMMSNEYSKSMSIQKESKINV